MSVYVKLGYEWKLTHEGEYYYLSNTLKQQLYQIDPGVRCQIIKKINDGVELDLLKSEYGEAWTSFKKQLEDLNVIFYSNNKSSYRDNFTLGARMALNSAFIQRAIDFRTVSIELNRMCNLNCSDCGDECCFPCFSCYKELDEDKEISMQILEKSLNYLANFNIQNIYLQGGDPLLSFKLIERTLNILNSINHYTRIYIISNGMQLLDLSKEQLSLLKNSNLILLLMITVETYTSNYLSNVLSVLHNNGIHFEVQYRNISAEAIKTQFRNDTIKFRFNLDESIVGQHNLLKPVDISVLNKDFIENRCFYGRIHIDVNGRIMLCNGYPWVFGNVFDTDWTPILNSLKETWNAPDDTLCSSCGLHLICVSCPSILAKHIVNSNDKSKVCSIIKT